MIIKREISLDNFAADIDIEVTTLAAVDKLFVNQMLMVATWINTANEKGEYKVYALPDGCINHPSKVIAEQINSKMVERSIDRTWVTAIEAVELK